jgi:hypothetical protein
MGPWTSARLPVCGPTGMSPGVTGTLTPSAITVTMPFCARASPSSTIERTLVVVSVTVSPADTLVTVRSSIGLSAERSVTKERRGLIQGLGARDSKSRGRGSTVRVSMTEIIGS